MRIFKIMTKEIKENLTDKKVMAMMVLFPILLMIILGFAFSNTFNNNFKLKDVKVIYTDNGSKEISAGFKNFIEKGKEIGIEFKEIKNIDQGISDIKNAKYSDYIVLKNDNITIYKNDRNGIDSNIVESMLSTFVDRDKAISAIAKANPFALKNITADSNYNFVDVVSLDRNRQPTSKDYYSVTMLTLIILYGSISGVYAIDSERTKKTGNRILTSPTKKYEILTGKLLGTAFSLLIQSAIVFVFSKYVLGAYWGSNIGIIFLLILSEILFSISIGVGLGFIIKKGNTASGIISAIIPFIAFLGGSYFPIDSISSKVLMQIANISPVKWTNSAIFQIIFSNDYSFVSTALLINLICAALFVGLSAYLFSKEAF